VFAGDHLALKSGFGSDFDSDIADNTSFKPILTFQKI